MKEKNKPKCKEWERRRREKLNEAFNILSQLLPNYDPAKSLAKIDVLERSTDFVKELRLSNSRLVSHQVESDEKCKLIKQLQDEVNKLILRVKQLTTLLKTANIPIPSGPSLKLGKKKLKWSGKVHPQSEDGSNSMEKVSDEENSLVVTIGDEQCDGDEIPVIAKDDANNTKGTEESIPQNNPSTVTPLKEMNAQIPSTTASVGESPKNTKTSTSRLKKRKALSASPTKTKAKVVETSNNNNPNPPPLSISSPTNKPPQVQTMPPFQPATILQNGTMIPLMNSAPITGIFTEPPKSTTATILPMQTIFLTSAPSNLITTQACSSPVITRIALGSPNFNHQLFSHGLLQKIPIQSIRKPIPKIKWKRKRRKAVVVGEELVAKVIPPSSSTTVIEKVNEPITIATINKGTVKVTQTNDDSPCQTLDTDVADEQQQPTSTKEKIKDSEKSDKCGGFSPKAGESGGESQLAINDSEKIVQTATTETEIIIPPMIEVLTKSVTKSVEPPPSEKPCEIQSNNENELMQIQLFAHEPEQEVMEVVEASADAVPSPSSSSRVLCELQSRKTTTIGIESSVEKASKSFTHLPDKEASTISSKSNDILMNANNKESADALSKPTPTSAVDHGESMNIDQEPTSSITETVTGDKISECIARSMDLIDAPDGELMELGDNWGTTNSPKSPISPTQMFLSMFPLLPKENVVPSSEAAATVMPTNPRLSIPTTGYSSSHLQQITHRSFFIDSMLPDDSNSSLVPVVVSSSNIPSRHHQIQSLGSTSLHYRNHGSEQQQHHQGKSTPRNVLTETSTSATIMPLATTTSSSTTTKTAKISSKASTAAAKSVVPEDKDNNRRSHTYSGGGQGSFKDLHLFNNDSVDFSTLHTLPSFTQMVEQQDFLRGGENSSSSRSRGLCFDPLFSLSFDQAGCNSIATTATAPATDHFHLQPSLNDISENIHQNLQFHMNRDHRSIENFSSAENQSYPPETARGTTSNPPTPQKVTSFSSPHSSQLQAIIPPKSSSSQQIGTNQESHQISNLTNFGSYSSSSAPYYSNVTTSPPTPNKSGLPPIKSSTTVVSSHHQPTAAASHRQLFRPQGHDLAATENQSITSSHHHHALQQSPKTGSNAKRLQNNKGHGDESHATMSKSQSSKSSAHQSKDNQQEKIVQQGNFREITHHPQSNRHVEHFSIQKSQPSTTPTFATTTKTSSAAEKRKSTVASQKKPRNNAKGEFDTNKTGRKDQDKDITSTSKKAGSGSVKQNIISSSCQPMEDFHQFAANSHHHPTSTASSTATPSLSTDIFNPLSQPPHFFGHSSINHQQTFDHTNLNIFPEFALPSVECNPHYDHYSMDFNFSSSSAAFGTHNTNQVSQQQQFQPTPSNFSGGVSQTTQSHHHNADYHQPPQQQPVVQAFTNTSRSASLRPTPFYLQDVNCGNFNNFEVQTSSNTNPSVQSHQQSIHASVPTPQSNPNHQTHQYGHNNASSSTSTTAFGSQQQPHHPPNEVNNPNSVASVGHRHPQQQQQHHYFQSPVNSQSQQHNNNNNSQPVSSTYPNTTTILPNANPANSNSRNVQIQQHSQYANPQPPPPPLITKTKHTPTASSVSQINQTLYSRNATNARPLPQPPQMSTKNTVSSSISSHRPSQHPVNWMTDNQTVPPPPTPISSVHNNNAFPTKPNIPTNPFSVSKLVGTPNTAGSASGNANISTKPQAHPHTLLSRQSSAGSSSSSYCAEALIRKNPTAINTSTQNSTTQIGWPPSSSSSSSSKPQQAPNFFQPSISSPVTSSSHPHNFNVNSSTQHSQTQHVNPYNTNNHLQQHEHNFPGSGYNFHNNPPSQSHPQNYEPFDQSSSGSNNQPQQHQDHLHFQPHNNNPHHIHHPHNVSSDSQHATSSVSNFNLSTIFPEMNDKRQQQQQQRNPTSSAGSSDNRPSTNSGGSNNSMLNVQPQNRTNSISTNCGYYAQPGQTRK